MGLKGFRDFILRGNLIELAIAFIIGLAFAALLKAFIGDLITPILAAFGGQPDFGSLSFTINNSKFRYGDFIDALLTFLLTAAVIYYLIVLPYMTYRARQEPPGALELHPCPFCFSEISIEATRCPHCTSHLTPAEPVPATE
jgi:large conductance mechanosensitive channel